MGNSPSETGLKGYRQLKKQVSPLIGEVSQVMHIETKDMHIVKSYNYSDQTDFRQQVRKLKMRRLKLHPNIVTLKQTQESVTKQFCGINCRVLAMFQFFERDLQDQYNQKLEKKQSFTEQELMDIIMACVSGLIFMQDNEIKRCHLTKKAIVMNKDGQIKILDQILANAKPHPYFSLLEDLSKLTSQDIFLAPELVKQLHERAYDPYFSPKSDIFTLGMLLVHLATRESLINFYDYPNGTVDVQPLLLKVSKIRYSQVFKDMLKMMLCVDPQARPGLITLQETLQTAAKRMNPKHLSTPNNHSGIEVLQKPQYNLMTKKLTSHTKQTDEWNSYRSQEYKDTFQLDVVKVSMQDDSKESEQIKQNSLMYKTAFSGNSDSPIRKITDLAESQGQIISYGKIIYQNGGYYEGEINGLGQIHGNGVLYYSSGETSYSGSWKHGCFHGFGTLFNEFPVNFATLLDYQDLSKPQGVWIRYQGEFNMDNKHGFGTLYFTNGQRFSGCFKQDEVSGYGTFHRKDGSLVNAVWQNNRLKKY